MFATYPRFTRLDLHHRDEYESYIEQFPAISDLSFATLMIWWNFQGDLAVSTLHGNLIIAYCLPGDEAHSGHCLVGVQHVDDSVCEIFRHQRANGQMPRLVHVPGRVVEHITVPERFRIREEEDYNEYIVPVSRLYPLERTTHNLRRKTKRFLHAVEGQTVAARALDLRDPEARESLWRTAHRWWHEKPPTNDDTRIEAGALQNSLRLAEELDVRNLCLFVDDEIEGFALYQEVPARRMIIINHIKVSPARVRTFDYMTYALAAECATRGIELINFEMDLGIPGLRRHKRELLPSEFLRKFTVEPAIPEPSRGEPRLASRLREEEA